MLRILVSKTLLARKLNKKSSPNVSTAVQLLSPVALCLHIRSHKCLKRNTTVNENWNTGASSTAHSVAGDKDPWIETRCIWVVFLLSTWFPMEYYLKQLWASTTSPTTKGFFALPCLTQCSMVVCHVREVSSVQHSHPFSTHDYYYNDYIWECWNFYSETWQVLLARACNG